jgi:hypothetical protein
MFSILNVCTGWFKRRAGRDPRQRGEGRTDRPDLLDVDRGTRERITVQDILDCADSHLAAAGSDLLPEVVAEF